jgi:hypothetical protein
MEGFIIGRIGVLSSWACTAMPKAIKAPQRLRGFLNNVSLYFSPLLRDFLIR